MRRLDERLPQPVVALARLATESFASADLGGRTQACPGDQMRRALELIKPGAQFGHDDLANALVDASDLVQDT